MHSVEEWWSDLIHRPCLQKPLVVGDADALRARFTEDQFLVQKPMTDGVRVIQVCAAVLYQICIHVQNNTLDALMWYEYPAASESDSEGPE